jgi:tripartite-type tricarboxylate transporter receptor subunit TctC
MMDRRTAASSIAALMLAPVLVTAAPPLHAQSAPGKPLRLVIPFPPGATGDFLARLIQARLSEAMAQPVVVENRTGAGGAIGTEFVARSAPDGHTLLVGGASSFGLATLLNPKLGYDPVRDFAPVIKMIRSPSVLLVHPSLPVTQVRDLVKLARARPGELAYSTSGAGTPSHLSVEMFNQMAGTRTLHIPYRGSPEALADLRAGNVQFAVNSLVSSMPFLQGGKLRAVAVTGDKRSPELPNLPTMIEAGFPGYEVYTWFGLAAASGAPRELIVRLNAELNRILLDPEIRSKITAQGAEVVGGTPEQLGEYMKSEIARWSKVVRKLDLKPD